MLNHTWCRLRDEIGYPATQELEEILDDDNDMADMYLSRRAAQRRWDGKTLRDDLAPGGDSFPTDGTTPVAAICALRCSRSSITCFWALHISRGYATGGKQHWLPRTSAAACFRWHIDLHGLSSSLGTFHVSKVPCHGCPDAAGVPRAQNRRPPASKGLGGGRTRRWRPGRPPTSAWTAAAMRRRGRRAARAATCRRRPGRWSRS